MIKNRSVISDRFRRIVALHIIKNSYQSLSPAPPLLLGIHGPTGEGKTFQCAQVLEEMHVKSFLISGGQLENEEAGQPAKLIRELYLRAGKALTSEGYEGAVVLINDIDTGLGNWGNMVQYTVNRQTVFGELMHLVDYPTSVNQVTTPRVPIIITGNDLSKLYEPLVRAGRMTAFEWIPTIEERIAIVGGIFTDLSLEQVAILVRQFPKQPIAFFSHLKSFIQDESLWNSISSIDLSDALRSVRQGSLPDLTTSFSITVVVDAAKRLSRDGELVDHLGGLPNWRRHSQARLPRRSRV